jgi:hypothetical protein
MLSRGGDHSSGPPIARRLDAAYPRVSRKRASALALNGPGRPSPPIWPCTARGLPCRGHCCPCGRLLPYRFTLARRSRFEKIRPRFGLGLIIDSRSPAVYFLWHCPWPKPRRGVRPPGVTRRAALRSPDFPPGSSLSGFAQRSPSPLAFPIITDAARQPRISARHLAPVCVPTRQLGSRKS